jgi:UMF1 family MFS transporter
MATKRETFGWLVYDWANSAFTTTVVTVLAGPYLTALAQAAVGENGIVLDLGPLGAVTAKSFFPFCISLSVGLQVLLLPALGAVADYTHLKKRLMAVFCYAGAAATCLMVFVADGRYLLGGALFIAANVSFGASLVLYNAFLNEVALPSERDAVSSRGYALGYLGGGILLAINLVMVQQAAALGLSRSLAVRLSFLSAGVWWGGFAVVTFRRLEARAPLGRVPAGQSILRIGVREALETLAEVRTSPQALKYLASYMAFNDGIQTVIGVASVFLAQELFVARGLPADEAFLIGLILMVQFVAVAGALAFERIATVTGTKHAIALSLLAWTGVVIYAYALLATKAQAWAMGVVIALVLGGSQALSRSLFSQMIPPGREASFFGLYEISERGTSWIGPLLFGIVVGATNSYRQAILSLIVLFVGGLALLFATDTDEAVRQARRIESHVHHR